MENFLKRAREESSRLIIVKYNSLTWANPGEEKKIDVGSTCYMECTLLQDCHEWCITGFRSTMFSKACEICIWSAGPALPPPLKIVGGRADAYSFTAGY